MSLDRIRTTGLSLQERLFPFFPPEGGELVRSCDYIIFFQHRLGEEEGVYESTLFTFLIELKEGGRGSWRQLQNSCLLARHIIEAARLHYHGRLRSHPEVRYRGITFTSRAEALKFAGKRISITYSEEAGALPELKYARAKNGTTYYLESFCDHA